MIGIRIVCIKIRIKKNRRIKIEEGVKLNRIIRKIFLKKIK